MAQDTSPAMLLVMGVTGSGKSSFINMLLGQKVADSSDSQKAQTVHCMSYAGVVGKINTLIVDTPGFDDTTRSDTEILTVITEMLASQYKLGIRLQGILFLRNIQDNRFRGTDTKTRDIFIDIVGPSALSNVLLVTTHWDDVKESHAARHEQELRDDFWSEMLSSGASLQRYYNSSDSAIGIASKLLSKESVVLRIQREMADEGKALIDTAAGAKLSKQMGIKCENQQRHIATLEDLRNSLGDDERAEIERLAQLIEQKQRELGELDERMTQQKLQLQENPVEKVAVAIEKQKRSRSQRWVNAAYSIAPFVDVFASFVGMSIDTAELLSLWMPQDTRP